MAYTYHAIGQLTDASIDGVPAYHYEYDQNGNRTVADDVLAGDLATATYDAQDRLIRHGSNLYTYDADGYLTTREDTVFGDITTYDYDSFGDLREAGLPDGTVISYLARESAALALVFDRELGYVFLCRNTGELDFAIRATSGAPGCINDPGCEHAQEVGPIPAGEYFFELNELSDPFIVHDWVRNLLGDWGDFRVPLHPLFETDRSGFFLHGGRTDGSLGCVDVGGGVTGDRSTREFLDFLDTDPDGRIPLTVR